MIETESRPALENALSRYASHDHEVAARRFLEALSMDELLYLAESLGACVPIAATARPDEDSHHKTLVLREFATLYLSRK